MVSKLNRITLLERLKVDVSKPVSSQLQISTVMENMISEMVAASLPFSFLPQLARNKQWQKILGVVADHS